MADPGPWDELKLLQDKIDKIGAFRFQVRGWAVTLISAAVLGVYAAPVPPLAVWLLVPVVAVFWMTEHGQANQGRGFTSRAIQLEQMMEKDVVDGTVPGDWYPRIAKAAAGERFGLSQYKWFRWCCHGTLVFYTLLLVLITLSFFLMRCNPSKKNSPDPVTIINVPTEKRNSEESAIGQEPQREEVRRKGREAEACEGARRDSRNRRERFRGPRRMD